MHDRDDVYIAFRKHVEDAERKTAQDSSSHVAMDDGRRIGKCFNALEASLQFVEERISEPL